MVKPQLSSRRHVQMKADADVYTSDRSQRQETTRTECHFGVSLSTVCCEPGMCVACVCDSPDDGRV